MAGTESDLVVELRTVLGDALRVVATYDEAGYEFLHRRPDVEALYTPEEVTAVFDDMVIQGLSREFLERLFHAGDLDCTLHKFDDAVVCHFVEEYRGLVVSFDADVDVELVEFLDDCELAVDRHLRDG